MRKQYIAGWALAFMLILISALLIFGHWKKSPARTSSSNGVVAQMEVRAKIMKALEARVAKSDPDAQLSLAKLLLDGTETPPDYKRARGLLASASKRLPEAIVGLEVLQSWGFMIDKTMPDAATLKAKALATQDAFAVEFFNRWTPFFTAPPDWVLKLASSGDAWGEAKLAAYYGSMSDAAALCRQHQDAVLKLERANLSLPSFSSRKCSPVPKVPNSRQLAIKYASDIVDAKENEAEKIRYWTSLDQRIDASRPPVVRPHVASPFDLERMRFEHVWRKSDPYSEVIASGLSMVGRMLEHGKVGYGDPALALKFLTRAAELGDDTAQDELGELYSSGGGGGVKDFDMAARYFAQSAQQANEPAMKSLGLAFTRGQGVEPNRVQAYLWLSLSTLGKFNRGVGIGLARLQELQRTPGGERFDDFTLDPGVVRDELAQTMTAEEIAKAQRLAREWLPSYQAGPPPSIASINAGTIGILPNVAARASGRIIPMQNEGGGYVVPVLINNSITLNFVVDSGASVVTVPSDVVTTLIRTGTLKNSDFLDMKTYVLADGSKVPSRTFRIRSLKIGDMVVENVIGSVAPVQGGLLLGQSFLGRFKLWSIDNTKHELVLQ